MANAPESILARWQVLEQEGVNIPPAVWAEFNRHCLSRLDEIDALVRKANGGDLSVADARAVNTTANAIQNFIIGIGISSDGVCGVLDGRVSMGRTVLDLTHHYIGNDLYKIVLLADVYDKDPQPVPGADAVRILDCVKGIREFIGQLKQKTRSMDNGGAK